MLRLSSQQRLQNRSCFFLVIQNNVQPGEIEIRLVKIWGGFDTYFEFLFRFPVALFPDKQDA